VLIWIVGIPLVSYLAILFYLFLFQRQLLYFPDRSHPFLAGLPQLGVREVTLQTADGLALSSWFLPPPNGAPTIAYFHGNGGNIAYRADRLMRFARAGYGMLLVEYRGYGGNPGSPSEAGFNADADAAYEFLRRQGIAGERLVLYGESLGSAVAVRLAATQKIGALILESPFTSIAAVAQYHYPLMPAALLVWDRFDALARIGEVAAPVLFLRGGRDRVVPPRLGDALFDAAPEPKRHWFAADAGHEDLARFGALDAAIAFIDQHVR
jgi:uncharacterized protein